MSKQLLFLTLFTLTSCYSVKEITPISHDEVKLTISTSQCETSDSLIVTVTFENNTGATISIHNRQEVSTSKHPSIAWNLNILFEDTLVFLSPYHLFITPAPTTRQDYLTLENGCKYVFNFVVNFNILQRDQRDSEKSNKNYGIYTLQLVYKDPYCLVKNAIAGQIYSNSISISFKKNEEVFENRDFF